MNRYETVKITDVNSGDTIVYGGRDVRVVDIWSWETESGVRQVGVKLVSHAGYVVFERHDSVQVKQ